MIYEPNEWIKMNADNEFQSRDAHDWFINCTKCTQNYPQIVKQELTETFSLDAIKKEEYLIVRCDKKNNNYVKYTEQKKKTFSFFIFLNFQIRKFARCGSSHLGNVFHILHIIFFFQSRFCFYSSLFNSSDCAKSL